MTTEFIEDTGPWMVDVWDRKTIGPPKVVLQSDDFTYDAALVISGNFESLQQKIAYAEALAKKLNGVSKFKTVEERYDAMKKIS